MKKFIIFNFLSLIVYVVSAYGGVSSDNCDFYLRFKNPPDCSNEKDYLKSYGYKYCQKFLEQRNHTSEWSAKEILWSKNSGICLQEMLENNPKRVESSCPQLTSFAFDSHPICYKQYDFCGLSLNEKFKIAKMIAAEDICSEFSKSLIQILNVGISCFKLDDLFTLLGESTYYRLFFTCVKNNVSESFRKNASMIFSLMPNNLKDVEGYFKSVSPELIFSRVDSENRSALKYYNLYKEKNRFLSIDPNYKNIEDNINLLAFTTHNGFYNSSNPTNEPSFINKANKNYTDKVTEEQLNRAVQAAHKYNISKANK